MMTNAVQSNLIDVFAKMVTTLLVGVISFSCATTIAATPIPPPPTVPVKAYILLEPMSGKILAASHEMDRLEPASLTKLMSAYVIFDAIRLGKLKLTDDVLISEHAWRAEGSRTFVEVNTRVNVETLIQGMIIQSGNDATIALAEAVAGSEPTFVTLMNQYSQRLGLKDSHWMNSTGLPDPQHYTTAHDLAMIGAAIIRDFPSHYKYYSQREFTYNHITQQNRNGLLEKDSTVDGIKTGHTDAAGFCLAASAVRNGLRLVSVVLGAKNFKDREDASAALLGYGFSFYEGRTLYTNGQVVGNAGAYKTRENIPLVLHKPLVVLNARGSQVAVIPQLFVKKKLVAPLSASQPIGHIRILENNRVIADEPVYPEHDIALGNSFITFWDGIKLWFQ